jgi:hypothetical protein
MTNNLILITVGEHVRADGGRRLGWTYGDTFRQWYAQARATQTHDEIRRAILSEAALAVAAAGRRFDNPERTEHGPTAQKA